MWIERALLGAGSPSAGDSATRRRPAAFSFAGLLGAAEAEELELLAFFGGGGCGGGGHGLGGDFRSGTDVERAGEGDVPPDTEPEPGVLGSVVEQPSPPGMYSGL